MVVVEPPELGAPPPVSWLASERLPERETDSGASERPPAGTSVAAAPSVWVPDGARSWWARPRDVPGCGGRRPAAGRSCAPGDGRDAGRVVRGAGRSAHAVQVGRGGGLGAVRAAPFRRGEGDAAADERHGRGDQGAPLRLLPARQLPSARGTSGAPRRRGGARGVGGGAAGLVVPRGGVVPRGRGEHGGLGTAGGEDGRYAFGGVAVVSAGRGAPPNCGVPADRPAPSGRGTSPGRPAPAGRGASCDRPVPTGRGACPGRPAPLTTWCRRTVGCRGPRHAGGPCGTGVPCGLVALRRFRGPRGACGTRDRPRPSGVEGREASLGRPAPAGCAASPGRTAPVPRGVGGPSAVEGPVDPVGPMAPADRAEPTGRTGASGRAASAWCPISPGREVSARGAEPAGRAGSSARVVPADRAGAVNHPPPQALRRRRAAPHRPYGMPSPPVRGCGGRPPRRGRCRGRRSRNPGRPGRRSDAGDTWSSSPSAVFLRCRTGVRAGAAGPVRAGNSHANHAHAQLCAASVPLLRTFSACEGRRS